MKGIILAGGAGTRLRPATLVIGKQLLPVYDKPMIYYPLATLIHAGCNDILVITTQQEIVRMKQLLSFGDHFGLNIQLKVQDEPRGVAHGIQIASDFISNEPFWFILGDNLFHGPDFGQELRKFSDSDGATGFAYHVSDPSAYGVAIFDENPERLQGLVEKPSNFVSNWAIPGLYFFDASCTERARGLRPSHRGEIEILDLLDSYFQSKALQINKVSRGNTWFDLGTSRNLLRAAEFVQIVQERQGLLVGSPEEAAYNAGLLELSDLIEYFVDFGNKEYSNLIIESIQRN
jgi:glucose-1-phosphate thymidylyltransferase